VAQNTGGDFNILPADRFELRIRAPLLTRFEIFMNNQRLEPVNDTAAHPEFDNSGYWSITDVLCLEKRKDSIELR